MAHTSAECELFFCLCEFGLKGVVNEHVAFSRTARVPPIKEYSDTEMSWLWQQPGPGRRNLIV